MSTRRYAAIGAVAFLLLLGGCIGPFADDLSDEELDAEADYEWEADADVYATVDVGEAAIVYDLDGDDTSFELTRGGYYRDRAIDVEAVRYRAPNGTEWTGSELDISQSSSTTSIDVPVPNGTLAMTVPAGSKLVEIPGLVSGSYEVELPRGHRVGNFFLSDVSPSADTETVIDDRQVLTWDDNDDDIEVQFYLARDHYLFWGLILGGIAVAGLGTLYFRRKISRLATHRREIGQIDEED